MAASVRERALTFAVRHGILVSTIRHAAALTETSTGGTELSERPVGAYLVARTPLRQQWMNPDRPANLAPTSGKQS